MKDDDAAATDALRGGGERPTVIAVGGADRRRTRAVRSRVARESSAAVHGRAGQRRWMSRISALGAEHLKLPKAERLDSSFSVMAPTPSAAA